MANCSGTIANCIIWGNTAADGPQLLECSVPSHCCIQDWTAGGEGNISDDPLFVDAGGPDGNAQTWEDNNYRLSAESPCVDAGNNAVLSPPGLDLHAKLRIAFGRDSLTVDMGAWEYYINTLSRELGGNAVLTWSSLAGKTYSVLISSDMLTWQTGADGVSSAGNTTTTWTDTTAPFRSPTVRIRYYRTVEK